MRHLFIAALLGSTALIPAIGMAQAQQAQPNAAVAGANQVRPIAVSQIKGKDVYTALGQSVGEVERIILGEGNQNYAVIKFGEFLGLGGESRFLPLSRLAVYSDRIVIPGMTEAEFRALPVWRAGLAGYREVADTQPVQVVLYTTPAPAPQQARAADGTDIVVRQPAPTVRVDQAAPQVMVQQAPPRVSVRQPQPEIIVRQPQPTVTLNIPQPEIIVRMPEPDVNVVMAQPQVQVQQARPDVQVVRPQQPQVQVQVQREQPEVMVQQAQREPIVQVQRPEAQPQVRYERAEPRIVVQQPEGQPTIRFERAEARPDAAVVVALVDLDRDRNRMLSDQEFRPFATRVYTAWDANRNQRLERPEFYGGLYGAWDMNRDARITEAEYNQAWGTWGRGLDRIEFGRFDRNRDSFLDREEFAAGWGENGLFERWDADRGGWLADAEFGNGLFAQWDADRNRTIAEAEFNAWDNYNWGVQRVAQAGADPVATARERLGVGEVEATASIPASRDTRAVTITQLLDMDVYNFRGEELGEIDRVVLDPASQRRYAIVEHGGFLGIGEEHVALPLERFALRGNRLYIRGVTEQELEAMTNVRERYASYRELGRGDRVELGVWE